MRDQDDRGLRARVLVALDLLHLVEVLGGGRDEGADIEVLGLDRLAVHVRRTMREPLCQMVVVEGVAGHRAHVLEQHDERDRNSASAR